MLNRFHTRSLGKQLFRSFGTTNKIETERNNRHLARTYYVWDTVISKAYGVWLEDVEGNKLLDFHSGYCSTNQGHGHPKILKALYDQSKKLIMCSRAFNTDISGEFCEYMSKTFKYDKLIPMNSGTEGWEAAVKLARRWGYRVKGVESNKAEIVVAKKCFWGRSIGAISGSDDPNRYTDFGPLCPGFTMVNFNDVKDLEDKFKANPNISGFMVEPIQGEAGIITPDDGYLKKVRELCTKYKVLFIADEIQSGLGRAGDLLAHYHEEVRPDIIVLGKALSAGVIPMSVIMADAPIIDTIGLGQHGSTFGGYALGWAVSKAAIEVLIEEEMPQRSKKNGAYFKSELQKIKSPLIKEIRGRGLWNSLEVNKKGLGKDIAERLAKNGLACKNTHDTTLRLAPPLTIEKPELDQAVEIISKTLKEFE